VRALLTFALGLSSLAPAPALAEADGGVPEAIGPDAGPAISAPRLLQDSPAKYPADAVADQLSGDVELEILISEGGRVAAARVIRGVDPRLDNAALDAATGLVFEPARVGLEAVASYITYVYKFEPPPPPPPPRAVLVGELRRRGRNEPVGGATVSARDTSGEVAEETESVMEADAEGRFRFELPAGVYTISVAAPGLRRYQRGETLDAGRTVSVRYFLQPEATGFEETVRGERERQEVSRTDLKGEELRNVPGTMGGDPFRAILMLPGVSAPISGLGFPIIRGAAPASTGWYLDGVRLPQLFHFFLLSAVVHPRFIESIEFYPSAYPAQFGRFTGGIVSAQTAQGKGEPRGEASVDWINSGAFVESRVPIPGQKLDVAAGGRISYTSFALSLLSQLLDANGYADYWDYQTKADWQVPGDRGQLRLFVFGSKDEVGSVDPANGNKKTRAVEIAFHRADLRWRGRAGSATVEAALTLGADTLGLGPDIDIETRALFPRFTAVWQKGDFQLRVGGDAEWKKIAVNIRSNQPGDNGNPFTIPVSGLLAGLYTELTWDKGPWRVVGALRGDLYHTSYVDEPTLEPRLGVRYRLDDITTLKLGAGLYHQAPTAFIDAPGVDLLTLGSGFDHRMQAALHVAAGVERRIDRFGLDVDFQGYWSEGLVVRELNIGDDPDEWYRYTTGECVPQTGKGDQGPTCQLDPLRVRRGRSYGAELLVRRKLGDRLFGWVGYTLSRTERWTPGYPIWLFNLDQTHIGNAVVSYDLGESWTVGLGLRLNSGHPTDRYHLANVVVSPDQPPSPYDRCGGLAGGGGGGGPPFTMVCWVKERPLSDRLPLFWRLDARVEKRWIYESWTLALYLDVLNTTVNKEIITRDYSFDQNGQPVVQEDGARVMIPMLGVKGTF
jgi:TonB family protein